jgi:hypothetical protein
MRASTAYRNMRSIGLQNLLQLVNHISISASYQCSVPTCYCFAEYPDIKVFPVDPGTVKTDMSDEFSPNVPVDSTVGLAAATILYLTSGKADYLSGRYVSSTWDLGKVEREWKEKIVAQNGLVNKLSIPL